MNEVALFVGLGLVVAFLIALSYRLRLASKAEYAVNQEDYGFMYRVGEMFCYSLSGLVVTVVLFLLMELTANDGYAGILRLLFVIFQWLIGIVSSLGALVFGIIVVVGLIAKLISK